MAWLRKTIFLHKSLLSGHVEVAVVGVVVVTVRLVLVRDVVVPVVVVKFEVVLKVNEDVLEDVVLVMLLVDDEPVVVVSVVEVVLLDVVVLDMVRVVVVLELEVALLVVKLLESVDVVVVEFSLSSMVRARTKKEASTSTVACVRLNLKIYLAKPGS